MKTPFSKSVIDSPDCFWSSNRNYIVQRSHLMGSCVLNCWSFTYKADTNGGSKQRTSAFHFVLQLSSLEGQSSIANFRTMQGHYRNESYRELSILYLE